jgi:aryl-alcohol dehydrogenase-like predicted oxidoreductase
MERISLGKAGPRITPVTLGTMTFGREVDPSAAERMVAMALDYGINSFDTANLYGGGQSEVRLADALRAIGGQRAKDTVIATKVGMGVESRGVKAGLSPAVLAAEIDHSLKQLRRDAIDILYLHQPDPATPLEMTLEAVGQAVAAGKVTSWGISNYASWQLVKLCFLSRDMGLPGPVVAQQMWNILARHVETEFIPAARDQGCSIMAYNPLAGGLLTGKHTPAAAVPGSRFDGNALYRARYWKPGLFDQVERTRAIADTFELTETALALRFVASQAEATSVILGASSPAQLGANLDALAAGPLPAEAMEACDAVWEALRGPSPSYFR